MADIREMRIFSADQINVQENLPVVLLKYSKEVIRQNPADIVKFSRQYFEQLLKDEGYFEQTSDHVEVSQKVFAKRLTTKIQKDYKRSGFIGATKADYPNSKYCRMKQIVSG